MRGALVIGGSGFVGRRLVEWLGPRGIGTWAARPVDGMVAFDAVTQRLSDLLATLPIDVSHVIVLYGIVNPEECARDPVGTSRTNVESVIRVLEDAFAASLVPVFVSTDYVFDGRRGRRREDEAQCPNTEYGRQKTAIERWLGDRGGRSLVTRLSKVVSGDPTTHSVLGQWLVDLRDGKRMRSATDQIFSPAFVDDIARAIVDLADLDARGIVHVAGEPMSRYDLNKLMVDALRRVDPRVEASVEACSLRDIPFREERPLDTSLSTERMESLLPWRFKTMHALADEIAREHLGRP